MEKNPLDLEMHGKDTAWDVWKRRLLFIVLIVLCITFAAPTFASCTATFDPQAGPSVGTFRIGGETREIGQSGFWAIKKKLGTSLRYLMGQRYQVRARS